eukprot:snap_masked-scaffold_64-processed-gene-0.66-mRNA-1 protein AED:0.34 eAED:0.34 QI:0/0/0/0.5/1/1/2/0/368
MTVRRIKTPHWIRTRNLKQLGEGGGGSVYWFDKRFNKYDTHMAVKLIKTGLYWKLYDLLTGEENYTKKLSARTEIRCLKEAQINPFIVSYTYLYMELCPVGLIDFVHEFFLFGKDAISRRDVLSFPMAMHVIYPIIHALSFLHKKSFIHQDIKPSNILLDVEGIPKLCDFGLVLKAEKPLQFNFVRGTFMYASPEQIGLNEVTSKTDIYSLGVTLAQVLTGVKTKKLMNTKKAPAMITAQEKKDWVSEMMEEYETSFPRSDYGKEEPLKLLKRMMEAIPQHRPSASELLNFPILNTHRENWNSFVNKKLVTKSLFFSEAKYLVCHFVSRSMTFNYIGRTRCVCLYPWSSEERRKELLEPVIPHNYKFI